MKIIAVQVLSADLKVLSQAARQGGFACVTDHNQPLP